jgi:hypothetical protein
VKYLRARLRTRKMHRHCRPCHRDLRLRPHPLIPRHRRPALQPSTCVMFRMEVDAKHALTSSSSSIKPAPKKSSTDMPLRLHPSTGDMNSPPGLRACVERTLLLCGQHLPAPHFRRLQPERAPDVCSSHPCYSFSGFAGVFSAPESF